MESFLKLAFLGPKYNLKSYKFEINIGFCLNPIQLWYFKYMQSEKYSNLIVLNALGFFDKAFLKL